MLKLGAQNVKGMYLGGQEVKRAYLGSQLVFDTGGLPSGYTALKYIQSSGTQYINTGFAPNNNTRTVADFKFESVSSNAAIFGARVSFDDRTYQFWVVSGKYRSDYNTTYDQIWQNVNALTRNTVDKDKETTTVAGESKSYTNSPFSVGYSMYLFASNEKGTAMYQSKALLYSCKIYDNGTLVRDFIPCKNPSGAVGLYDMVGRTFYGNAGTGAFTAGPAV